MYRSYLGRFSSLLNDVLGAVAVDALAYEAVTLDPFSPERRS